MLESQNNLMNNRILLIYEFSSISQVLIKKKGTLHYGTIFAQLRNAYTGITNTLDSLKGKGFHRHIKYKSVRCNIPLYELLEFLKRAEVPISN